MADEQNPDQITEDDVLDVDTSNVNAPRKDYLTCNFMLHHEHQGEQPETVEVRFCDYLESDEQPLRKRMKLGPDWQPVVTGFTAPLGQLVLVNNAGAAERAKPIRNPGDFKADQTQVVEVSMGRDATPLLVRPGRFVFLEPADVSQMRIRAQVANVPIWLYCYPQ